MRKFCFVNIVLILCVVMPMSAQKMEKTVPDDELKGVWIYTSYKIGDKRFDNDFHSIKIYGENGEYCCARAQKLRCGT